MAELSQFSTRHGELIIKLADGQLPVNFTMRTAEKIYEFDVTASWVSLNYSPIFDPAYLIAALAEPPAIELAHGAIRLTYSIMIRGNEYPVVITLHEKVGTDALIARVGALESEVRVLSAQLRESKTEAICIPFDRILASGPAADQFMHGRYMAQQYRSWCAVHFDHLPETRALEFVDCPEARLLFNLHWLSDTKDIDFIAIAAPKISAAGLWFETRQRDDRAAAVAYRITSLAGLSKWATENMQRAFMFTIGRPVNDGFSSRYSDGEGATMFAIVVHTKI